MEGWREIKMKKLIFFALSLGFGCALFILSQIIRALPSGGIVMVFDRYGEMWYEFGFMIIICLFLAITTIKVGLSD